MDYNLIILYSSSGCSPISNGFENCVKWKSSGGICFKGIKLSLWRNELMYMKKKFEKDQDKIQRVMDFLKYGCQNSDPPKIIRTPRREIIRSMHRRSWPGMCFCGLDWCDHHLNLEYIAYEADRRPEVIGDISKFLTGACGPTRPPKSVPSPTSPILTGFIFGLYL